MPLKSFVTKSFQSSWSLEFKAVVERKLKKVQKEQMEGIYVTKLLSNLEKNPKINNSNPFEVIFLAASRVLQKGKNSKWKITGKQANNFSRIQ